ncbi:MAG: hypothetical protein WHU94_15075 [Thermogemmata sp.]|jgi:hypothetical protein|nr:hypothetical protein [Gemmataceae bacterium]
MTKQERVGMYMRYLVEEGYMPRVDQDGDIIFKFEGGTYLIIIDDSDDEYFRLVFPNFWSIDSEEERMQVYIAATHATAETKVTKVYPVRDNVWASIEMFCSPPEVFKSVFRRSLGALRAGVNNFREKMQS